jgi:hypothetical protein
MSGTINGVPITPEMAKALARERLARRDGTYTGPVGQSADVLGVAQDIKRADRARNMLLIGVAGAVALYAWKG